MLSIHIITKNQTWRRAGTPPIGHRLIPTYPWPHPFNSTLPDQQDGHTSTQNQPGQTFTLHVLLVLFGMATTVSWILLVFPMSFSLVVSLLLKRFCFVLRCVFSRSLPCCGVFHGFVEHVVLTTSLQVFPSCFPRLPRCSRSTALLFTPNFSPVLPFIVYSMCSLSHRSITSFPLNGAV